MGKITFRARTFLILFFLLGSSLTFLTATNRISADISITGNVTDASCFGESDGSIKTTISGGSGSYSITWSGTNQTTDEVTGLTAGTYIITVTDDTHSESKEFTISQPDALSVTSASSSDVSCYGGSDGTATAGTVSGGTYPYQYSIDNISFGSNIIFTGLSSGNHTIYIKDSNNCTTEQIINVKQPPVLTMAAPTSTPVSCYGGNDGTVTAGSASGGNGDFQYSIDGTTFTSSKSFSGLSAGIYTVTVKDSEGCTANQPVTVDEPAVLTMDPPTSIPASCNGGSDGTITAGTVSGGNSDYQYSKDGTTFTSSNSFSGFSAGTYTITVKDSNGCTATQTITVEEPTILTMAAPVPTPVSCNGGNDGTLTAGETSGGNGGYQYSIDGTNFTSSNTFSGLTAGDYTITVKDEKGCTDIQSVKIEEPAVLGMTAPLPTAVSCNGENDGTITAGETSGGNGGYQYSIDGTTFTSSNTFSGLTAGDYTVTVKDAKGCTATQTATIEEPAILSMAAPDPTSVSCNGGNDGTITAGSVSGGNSNYQFSIDGINFSSSNSFSGLSAGNYTITVKDSKGCTATQTATIEEPALLTMAAPVLTPVSCHGGNDGTITAGAVSGGNGGYQYSKDGINYSNTTNFTGYSAGLYKIYVRDAKGCVTEAEVEMQQPEELVMTASSFTVTTCFGGNDGTVTAGTVTGGNGDYQYSIDNTNYFTTQQFANLAAGTHTIFVKDSKGCSLQQTITVTEPEILNATTEKTDVKCFGDNSGIIALSNPTGGSGNYEYSMNGTEWTSSTNFTDLTAGSYQVLIRDKTYPSCTIILEEDLQIDQPSAALDVEVTTTRTTTYGTSTGSATANASGGTPGYTYEWKNAGQNTVLQNTKTATNLPAGLYDVTIIDSNGCTLTKQIEIIDAIQAFILTRSTCEVEDDIDAIRTFHYVVEDDTAIGGVGPFTYSWDFGVDAVFTENSGIGEFWVDYTSTGNKTITLTVTDSTGATYTTTQDQFVGKCYNPCGKSSNIEFDPNNIYMGYTDGTPIDIESPDYCNNTVEKFIFIQVDKSANIYNPYIELGFSISNTIDGTSEQYYVSGCRDGEDIDENLEVNQDNRVGGYIKLTIDPLLFDCGDNLNIDTFYTTWTNVSKKECGQNNNKFCYSTNEAVTVMTELKAQATPTPILCKGDSTGMIEVKASGGFAPYGYNITSATSTYLSNNQFLNLPAGVYTVYVEDAAGNKTTAEAEILEPDTKITATTEVITPVCFGETGEATVNASGGTPFSTGEPYQFLWNDAREQTTATATGLTAGEYTVTVIDANGCQILETITITEPLQLTVAETGEDITYNCGFRVAELWANTAENGIGTWSIISAENGGIIADPLNPTSTFTGNAGVHTLRWTIANENGTCATFSDVNVTFTEECSTLDFDGVDDYVYFDDTYGLSTGDFTIEAWVKPNNTGGIKTVLSKRNSLDLGEGGYDLIINNGSPTFRWGGSSSVSTSAKVNTDRWYHLAVIFKNNQVKLYVDGINVGTSSAVNPGNIPHPFLVGAMFKDNKQDKPQNLFNGWIEEVRIWNTSVTEEQLHFLMNQRVKLNSAPLRGTVLPVDVPGSLDWTNLLGYYRMIGETVVDGKTLDEADNKVHGELRNITTTQQNTAPLPYISASNSEWGLKTTWLRPEVWDVPNSTGINGASIDWNIARISHTIPSGARDITMLGLISEKEKLTIANPGSGLDENNPGQGLTITHYLKLNGIIDLIGESQLVQTDIENPVTNQTITSILDEASSGFIERDQQGTANSFNYNYWSSPVSLQGGANNSTYTVESVMLDGTASANPKGLSFNGWHEYADKALSTPRKISSYWIHKFRGTADRYSEWVHIGNTGILNAAEGYTMKGTSGYSAIEDRQNYVFKGKPNNGDVNMSISTGQNYLLGNPYPSSININEFILDNLRDVAGGTHSNNVFNGAVYFWDHFAGGDTHILLEYIGGYATRNLLDGVPAISNDYRINANEAKGNKIPGLFIPVAQGFFVNSAGVDAEVTVEGGDVRFRNSQRAFVRESTGDTGGSVFLKPEEHVKQRETTDTRPKLRLDYRSPMGYHRQILAGVDPNTTNGFDLGYDAPLNDFNLEDMYWVISQSEFVIQGVPDFNLDQVLPLGIKIKEEGEISIKINKLENIGEEVNIFLKDKEEKTYHNLRKSDFSKKMKAGNFTERFEIVFAEEQDPITEVDKPTEEEEDQTPENGGIEITEIDPDVFFLDNSTELLVKNPELQHINKITLHSLSGQIIEEYLQIATQKEVKLPVRGYSSSVYVVKMHTEKGIISKKLILNR